MTDKSKVETGRRGFLGAAGSLAGASLLGATSTAAAAQTTGRGSDAIVFCQRDDWRRPIRVSPSSR